MGLPGLRLVSRQKGPTAKSSFLPKTAYMIDTVQLASAVFMQI